MVAGYSEKRWTRTVQYERKLREDLEVNFEALATQMHGLENQARRATRTGMVMTIDECKELEDSQQFSSLVLQPATGRSGKESPILSKTSPSPTLPGRIERLPSNSKGPRPRSLAMSDHSNDPILVARDDGGEDDDDEDDDDDKFFDAPDAQKSATPSPPPGITSKLSIPIDRKPGMEASESSTSIMLASSPASVNMPPESLPTGIRMSVSEPLCLTRHNKLSFACSFCCGSFLVCYCGIEVISWDIL